MATYTGGSAVRSGHYIEGRSFEWAVVRRDGDPLPGAPATRWVRVPTVLAMAAAPAIGGLLVIGLPFISVGVAAYTLARALGGQARANAEKMAALLVPGFAPGEAHLAGEPHEGGPAAEGEAKPAAPHERLDKLEAEIRALRDEQRR
jgi:hypothetical protein